MSLQITVSEKVSKILPLRKIIAACLGWHNNHWTITVRSVLNYYFVYATLVYQKMLFLAIKLYSKLATLQISKQIRTQIHSSFVFLTVVHVRRRYGVPRGASRGYNQMCQYKPAQSFQYPWEALGDQSPDYIQLWKLQVRYKKKKEKKTMVKKVEQFCWDSVLATFI